MVKAIKKGPEAVAEQRRISDLRGKWLAELTHSRKVELAFELEMLLKATDRFFNIDNLPLTEPERAIAVNFKEELEIAFAYVNRIVNVTREIMEAGHGHMFQFQSYVETTLLNDLGRTKIREASFEQSSPDESLFLLYTGFVNIRGILRALLRSNRLPYPLYVNVGNLVSREIIWNRFFNPVREIEFRPEFDRIENRKISRLAIRIVDDPLRRHFSVVLLVLFRLLRYLSHINPNTNNLKDLRNNIPIFALINSESRQLVEYLEKILPNALKENPETGSAEDKQFRNAFVKTTDSVGFQLTMELKKINRNELMGSTKTKDVSVLRSAIENSHGVLSNFFQQSIIQVARVFDQHVEGKDIFPFYTSRLRHSLQLRNDIWVFKELMERFEEKAETDTSGDTEAIYIRYLNILKDYIRYFRMESYNLLRYDDLKEFDKFFAFIGATEIETLKNRDTMNQFIYKSKYFKIFLETTLGNIENRAELANRPVDSRSCERFLKEFILASMRRSVGQVKPPLDDEPLPKDDSSPRDETKPETDEGAG